MINRILFTLSLLLFALPAARVFPADETFNPYRVLLVIADQWQDPASFLIDIPLEEPPVTTIRSARRGSISCNWW